MNPVTSRAKLAARIAFRNKMDQGGRQLSARHVEGALVAVVEYGTRPRAEIENFLGAVDLVRLLPNGIEPTEAGRRVVAEIRGAT